MTDDNTVPPSLMEQIAYELALRLKDKKGFNSDLIKKIEELARNGELKKRPKLTSLLKSDGEHDETAGT